MKSVFNKIVRVDAKTPTINLNDLNDVNVSTAANGQILKFDGTNWLNSNEIPAGVLNFNTRTGAVLLNENDLLPLRNSYFEVYNTYSTATVIAEPNKAYFLNFGGTVQIPAMDAGSHVMVCSVGNPINIQFSGAGIVANSYLEGSTINPTFLINFCSIELVCAENSGQQNWFISRISQNHPNSVCTLNGQKVSALSKLNDIPDLNITAPIDGQFLGLTAGKWSNLPAVNSFNTRTGAVLLNENDLLPLRNSYYEIVNTYSTATIIAEPNKAYSMKFGGTVQIGPMAAGSHIMILAGANTMNVNFIGGNIVGNSYLAGSTINPPFSLLFCTLELECTENSGQTNWYIVNLFQNHPNSFCTLNGQKVSAISKLNDIPDLNITGPQNDQILKYSAGKWLNSTIYQYFYYNSVNNLINGQYLLSSGTTGSLNRAKYTAMSNFKINRIFAKLENPPGTGFSRTFTIYKNDVATAMQITISGTAVSGETTANQVSGVSGDDIAIRHDSTIFASASVGNFTIEYV